jgi:predicted GNAT family N-acyltransferase
LQNLNAKYKTSYGHELQSPVLGRFYKRNGYKGKIQPEDLCCWLELNGEIVAAARILAHYSGTTSFSLLRGVWVDKSKRGKRLGSQLLRYISKNEVKKNNDLYCLALPHLEQFYMTNQYKKAEGKQIPDQLTEMANRYKRRGQDSILMMLSVS